MGSGIAQTAADAGFYVRMYDVNPEAAEAGLKRLKKQLARDAEKGKRTETEVKSVISRISISQTLEEAEHADIVIEAYHDLFDFHSNPLFHHVLMNLH